MNIDRCDMCGSQIINKKCSCGIWKEPDEMEDCPFKASMEKFHHMKQLTFSAEMPHLGCAMLLFRGDYNDCEKIKKFIYEMKSRPHYKE